MRSRDTLENHPAPPLPKQYGRLSDRVGRRHTAWWQSPLMGYACSILLVVAAFFFNWLETFVDLRGYFLGILFVIGTFFICWTWGTGPAILALIVEVFCVDYLMVPPLHSFSFYLWPGLASFIPFIIIQTLILWLIAKQKNYEARLLSVQRELSLYAVRVEESNQRLAESNAQLEQADRVKDQFLSMASHELRTPVTSIHGYLQLLMRRLKKQSPPSAELLLISDILVKMDEQTRHLICLIDDLLAMNCLRLGKMPFQMAICELCALCREVIAEQKDLTDHQIDLSFCPDHVIVQADKERISQVVLNLVMNAIKYSPADAVIRVGVHQGPSEAILSVQNDGPVLSPEQQKKLFEPFHRSAEARLSGMPGWGLGLTISRAIVEQHCGRIWVESVEGKGTTFFVALPLPSSSDG